MCPEQFYHGRPCQFQVGIAHGHEIPEFLDNKPEPQPLEPYLDAKTKAKNPCRPCIQNAASMYGMETLCIAADFIAFPSRLSIGAQVFVWFLVTMPLLLHLLKTIRRPKHTNQWSGSHAHFALALVHLVRCGFDLDLFTQCRGNWMSGEKGMQGVPDEEMYSWTPPVRAAWNE